jgi:hypothetical protein
MLNIALDKLPSGGAQKMFARHRRSRQRECHPVLKLVAETVSAARLIKRRSRPQAADEGLVEQPAIEHNIHRPVRCAHLNCAEHIVPMLHDLAEDRVKTVPGMSINGRQASV